MPPETTNPEDLFVGDSAWLKAWERFTGRRQQAYQGADLLMILKKL